MCRNVKAAPESGWFFPAALPGDTLPGFPNMMPSDLLHFQAGTPGNELTNAGKATLAELYGKLYGLRESVPAACVAAQQPGEWWACTSVHIHYKYIKAPLFIIENQFDANQVRLPLPNQSKWLAQN